jgi:hypothetical protein
VPNVRITTGIDMATVQQIPSFQKANMRKFTKCHNHNWYYYGNSTTNPFSESKHEKIQELAC